MAPKSWLPSGRDQTHEYEAAPSEDWVQQPPPGRPRRSWWANRIQWLPTLKYILRMSPILILAFFGLLHITLVLLGRKRLFWDVSEYLPPLPSPHDGIATRPFNVTRDVVPIPCHSHNDYWRRIPLYDALRAGCVSVEADVWWFEGKEDLFVGHDTASLRRERTLDVMYVQPLVEMLDRINAPNEFSPSTSSSSKLGVFSHDPTQTLILLVDLKTHGPETFPLVHSHLEPLRQKNYLTVFNGTALIPGPITVIGTGNTPFDLVTATSTHRDIFFDAPLDEMYESSPPSSSADVSMDVDVNVDKYNTTNSLYASVSFRKSLGRTWTGTFSSHQLNLLRGQIRGAHRRGLKVRYWDTPAWPTSVRNRVWEVLVGERVDMLNVDDLAAAARMDWGQGVPMGWFDG